MIEDKELREIFKQESEEHLQRLNEGLLLLEKEPENKAYIEEVFREAHSLKGAARMINLTKIESLSHHMEDILGSTRKGEMHLTPALFDTLLHTLDVIKNLVNEAVTGEGKESGLSEILERLKTSSAKNNEMTEESNPNGEEKEQAEIYTSSGTESFRIESIRVETEKLDDLMTLVGELNVTRSRTLHRFTEIEEAIKIWDLISRTLDEGTRELSERLDNLLIDLKNGIFEDSSKLDLVCGELDEKIRFTRLLPMSTLFNLFPRLVRDLERARGLEVKLIMEGGETRVDKRIIEEMKDPLMHLIRNAMDHGFEEPGERQKRGKPITGSIILKASQTGSAVMIEVKDDGKGMDSDAIRQAAIKLQLDRKETIEAMSEDEIFNLVFIPGFSTSSFVSDISGRGIGLDVVRANAERLKGSVRVESKQGQGTCFSIQLPVTLATIRVMIASICKLKYGIPLEFIEQSLMVKKEDIFSIEGRETIRIGNSPVSVVRLMDLLELPMNMRKKPEKNDHIPETLPCVVISSGGHRIGLLVDEMVDEQEVVLKPQSKLVKKIRNVSGATILGTGEICMILSPGDIIKSVRKKELAMVKEKPKETAQKKIVLTAEDSLTTRTQMKRILEGAGYDVVTAVDGLDAYNKLGRRDFDAVITDVLMPNMDGIKLTAKIRQDRKYSEMPIILVTSLALDEDRKKGLEAGANAYITKPGFDQKVFLDTLKRLL